MTWKRRQSSKSRGTETKKWEKESEKENEVSVSEKGKEKKRSKESVGRTLILKQSMIVLMYKEVCLSTNELNSFLSSVIISLL